MMAPLRDCDAKQITDLEEPDSEHPQLTMLTASVLKPGGHDGAHLIAMALAELPGKY